MAVPRNRSSNQRSRTRRSHMAKKAVCLADCDNCGVKKRPHRVCPSCGHYAKRAVEVTKESGN